MTTERRPETIADEIRGMLDDEPIWVDFEDRDDELIAHLLREGRQRHVPRELLWEYTAARWQELYAAPEEEEEEETVEA
jgi:glycosyltransferase involved in cell wall biosynthesis